MTRRANWIAKARVSKQRILSSILHLRLSKPWEFIANPMFLISLFLLALIVIPPRPFPELLGGAQSSGDAIEIAEVSPVSPDFTYHASYASVTFDLQQQTVRFQVLWEGRTPGLFYFSLPFKFSIKYLAGNGGNTSNILLVKPPTRARNGLDWFLSVRDPSHGIDLVLNDPDIVSHSLWRDVLPLSFGVSFVPEVVGNSFPNGTYYPPSLVLLEADSIFIQVFFPSDETVDTLTTPSPTGLTLGGVFWTLSHPASQIPSFYYAIQLSLVSRSPLALRLPPMFSADIQQPILLIASIVLGAHFTSFLGRRSDKPKKIVSGYWVVITVIAILMIGELV